MGQAVYITLTAVPLAKASYMTKDRVTMQRSLHRCEYHEVQLTDGWVERQFTMSSTPSDPRWILELKHCANTLGVMEEKGRG